MHISALIWNLQIRILNYRVPMIRTLLESDRGYLSELNI